MADFAYIDGGFSATQITIRPVSERARERMGYDAAAVSSVFTKSAGFAFLDRVILDGFTVEAEREGA